MKMKYVVTSDLHGYLPHPGDNGMPEKTDYLLICGDISPLEIQFNVVKMEKWLIERFVPWANAVANETILIAGNHDYAFQTSRFTMEAALTHNIHFLEDSMYTTFEGIRIWGTPWCKVFGNWPYMISGDMLKEKYQLVPENIDIWISHDSPYLNGLGTINEGWSMGEEAGNMRLTDAIRAKMPRYFFSGHIHSGNHKLIEAYGVEMANVSINNERYNPTFDVLTLEIEPINNKQTDNTDI